MVIILVNNGRSRETDSALLALFNDFNNTKINTWLIIAIIIAIYFSHTLVLNKLNTDYTYLILIHLHDLVL